MRAKFNISIAIVLFLCITILFVAQYRGVVYTAAYPIFRTIGEERLIKAAELFNTVDYNGFSIQYSNRDANNIYKIKNIINKYGNNVFDYFDYGSNMNENIGIIIFPSQEELHRAIGISEEKSTIGAYYGGRVNLLSPDILVQAGEEDGMLANVFVHELTHLTVDHLTRGNCPLWFTEGSALYMEYYLLDYEWGREVKNTNYSIDDLTYRFNELDEYLAYRQSFVEVKNMIDNYGREKYISLLKYLGQGMDFFSAYRRVYGEGIDNKG